MKKDINRLLKGGFTPCLDFVTRNYPKGVDLVLGKLLRYSTMSMGKCVASRKRLSAELNINETTLDARIKILVVNGLIIDETPSLRNHPHSYTINTGKLLEQLALFEDGEEVAVLSAAAKENLGDDTENPGSAMGKSNTGYRDSRLEDTENLEENLREYINDFFKNENSDSALTSSVDAYAPPRPLAQQAKENLLMFPQEIDSSLPIENQEQGVTLSENEGLSSKKESSGIEPSDSLDYYAQTEEYIKLGLPERFIKEQIYKYAQKGDIRQLLELIDDASDTEKLKNIEINASG